jgi:hypothetical protein
MVEHLMRTPFGGDSGFEAVTGRLGGLWRRLPRRRNSRAAIVRRLEQLERLTRGGNATYVGNNRLLTGLMVDNIMLALLVEADDRLIVPHFTMTGIHEAWATRFFLNNVKPHHHCLDIGANFAGRTPLRYRSAIGDDKATTRPTSGQKGRNPNPLADASRRYS